MNFHLAQNIAKATLVLVATVTVSQTTFAASCGSSPNAVNESREFAAKIYTHLGQFTPSDFVKVKQGPEDDKNLLDHKFHKIDRSIDGYKQLNSVGIVTGKPFQGQLQTYGSAVLISACGHVITNRHVVAELAKENGQNFGKGNQVFFSTGQAKSCDQGNDFEEQNVAATVIAHGESEGFGDDWVILKLNRTLSKEIQPAIIMENGKIVSRMRAAEKAIRVGYPVAEINDGSGFKNVRAQYVQGLSITGNLSTAVSDQRIMKGLSGGAAFVHRTNPDQQGHTSLLFAGMPTAKNEVLSVISIFEKLAVSDRQVALEILQSITKNSCQ